MAIRIRNKNFDFDFFDRRVRPPSLLQRIRRASLLPGVVSRPARWRVRAMRTLLRSSGKNFGLMDDYVNLFGTIFSIII